METISGIYKIVNKINGKYYVGSSQNIYRRWTKHKRTLNQNVHHCKHLQRAWNKHGSDNFEFIIVEEHSSDLLRVEQLFLDVCRANPKSSYNESFHSSGGQVSDEMVLKIKQAWTPEKKQLHSQKYFGKNNPFFGKQHSDKNRAIMRQLKLGKPLSKSHCENISKATSGVKNPSYDPTVFKFINPKTNEHFIGTKFEFRTKYKTRWKTPKAKWQWTINDYCLPLATRAN